MGGIASQSPIAAWPRQEKIRWLVPADWFVPRPDVVALDTLGMDFTDALASSDALICKPGYGSFAEAACNGVPVLYVSRHDWPEEGCLVSWLKRAGVAGEIGRQDFASGALEPALNALWARPRPAPVKPSGIEQAAGYLLHSMSIASP
jgi:hypothetical protein